MVTDAKRDDDVVDEEKSHEIDADFSSTILISYMKTALSTSPSSKREEEEEEKEEEEEEEEENAVPPSYTTEKVDNFSFNAAPAPDLDVASLFVRFEQGDSRSKKLHPALSMTRPGLQKLFQARSKDDVTSREGLASYTTALKCPLQSAGLSTARDPISRDSTGSPPADDGFSLDYSGYSSTTSTVESASTASASNCISISPSLYLARDCRGRGGQGGVAGGAG